MRTSGYTLIEVMVVLLLLTLVALLVAPALRQRDDPERLAALVGQARITALRRGEALALRLEPSGAWRLDGLASGDTAAITQGVLSPAPAAPLTLIFSPLGTCAPDVATAAAAEPLGFDPLTCEHAP